MRRELLGRTIAILVADGFEQDETTVAKGALEQAGAHIRIVSLEPGTVGSWAEDRPGQRMRVDITVNEARAEDFDGLLVAGAVLNAEALRQSGEVARFVRGFFDDHKPVAAMSQALQGLLDADVLRERTLTSFPSVRGDLINVGANWVDASVVVDHGLVTSRSVADMDEFMRLAIAEFAASGRTGERDRGARRQHPGG